MLWALSNIAGDSTKHRDAVMAEDVLPLVAKICETVTELGMLRRATWTMFNIFKDGKLPSEAVRSLVAIPHLKKKCRRTLRFHHS